MNFIHSDLGFRQPGELVEIVLSGGANVRLMDNAEFSSYRSGRAHRFIGGLAKRSPIHLAIPSAGHWHVAVDMQGLRGTAEASIRVLSGAPG
jgi:Domain of unknown function (DUF1883)